MTFRAPPCTLRYTAHTENSFFLLFIPFLALSPSLFFIRFHPTHRHPSCLILNQGFQFPLEQGWSTYGTRAQIWTPKTFLARGIHCCPNILLLARPASLILWRTCVYTYIYIFIHISDTVQTVYELPLIPNNTAVKHFYTNRIGEKCWLDVYGWGGGLVVTGPIRDIGRHCLAVCFCNRK